MTIRLKDTKDIIIYSCGNKIGTDKEKLQQNLALDEHYACKPINKEIKASVLETEKVFNGIMEKLSNEEKYVLNNLCKII